MCCLLRSISLYAYESWTLTEELQRRMQIIEISFYCKILRILCNNNVDLASNRITRRPAQRKETKTAEVWIYLVFIRSGQNHLARHSQRRKKQGRQKKRLEDNIREWAGLELAKSKRAGGGERENHGGNWMWSHLWCPSDPRGETVGEGEGSNLYDMTNSITEISEVGVQLPKWR